MRVSARAEYATRIMIELASVRGARPVTADQLAQAQAVALPVVVDILRSLRRCGLIRSKRGRDGGYFLGRAAHKITVADVLVGVDGPLLQVGDGELDGLPFYGPTAALADVWVAVHDCLEEVLAATTLADVAAGSLAEHVSRRVDRRSACPPARR